MIETTHIKRLLGCFRHSFINHNFEFVARRDTNCYFRLDNCKSEFDIKCKVLEWLSREAHKGMPFKRESMNVHYREMLTSDINQYLGTSFEPEQMETIYTYLGNACNHEKTIRFIESGYDMSILTEGES